MFFLALSMLSLLGAAHAQDSGNPLTSENGKLLQTNVAISVHASQDGVLWESGPTDRVPADFNAVLFQGAASDPSFDVVFEAALGPDYSHWVEAEVWRVPNGRFGGSIPISGGKGSSLRLRMIRRGTAAGTVKVFWFHAEHVQKERPRRGTRSSQKVFPRVLSRKLQVLPREAWGAAPPEEPYEWMTTLSSITVHHTTTVQTFSLADSIHELKIIQRFHQRGRKFIDIGYHFVIDGAGRIFQGRPEIVIGAHVLDHNDGNIGIALLGNFTRQHHGKPTSAQMKSLVALIRWLVSTYGIDPREIRGHRDYLDENNHQRTTCPGENLYAKLPAVRRAAASARPVASIALPLRDFETLAAARPLARFGPLLRDSGVDRDEALHALFDSAGIR